MPNKCQLPIYCLETRDLMRRDLLASRSLGSRFAAQTHYCDKPWRNPRFTGPRRPTTRPAKNDSNGPCASNSKKRAKYVARNLLVASLPQQEACQPVGMAPAVGRAYAMRLAAIDFHS